MKPALLSQELRNGSTKDMQRRRWIVGLSMLGSAMVKVAALYQIGSVKRLPSVRKGIFDANKVDSSNYAYRFNVPTGFLKAANFGLTSVLAAAGGPNRARTTPWIPVAMGAKALVDSVLMARMAQQEWRENRAQSEYGQIAALASYATFALALPETRNAIRNLFGGKRVRTDLNAEDKLSDETVIIAPEESEVVVTPRAA